MAQSRTYLEGRGPVQRHGSGPVCIRDADWLAGCSEWLIDWTCRLQTSAIIISQLS